RDPFTRRIDAELVATHLERICQLPEERDRGLLQKVGELTRRGIGGRAPLGRRSLRPFDRVSQPVSNRRRLHHTTPFDRSCATSCGLKPRSFERTASVCSPSSGGAVRMSPAVSDSLTGVPRTFTSPARARWSAV